MNSNKWNQVFRQAPMGMFILSLDGTVIDCNPAAHGFWGDELCDHAAPDIPGLLNTSLDELIDLFSDPEQTELSQTIHLNTPELVAHHPYILKCANPTAWLTVNIAPIRDDQGKLSDLLVSHTDISDLTYSRQVIADTAMGVSAISGQGFFESLVIHLARIFNAQYAFIGLYDDNKKAIKTIALSAGGVIAENFSYALKDTPCEEVVGQDTCAICTGVQALYPDDLLLQEMNIEGYIGSPIFDPDGTPLGIMVVLDTKPLERVDQVKSILEIFAARAGAEIQRMDAEEQIHRMAYEDYLTHLPNRASLYLELKRIQATTKEDAPEPRSALFMIDLDHFKTINDALGHDIGDEIIRKAGERLRQKLPEEIFISRIGGDEFVVLLNDEQVGITEPQVRVLSEKILFLLTQPFQVGDRIINIGASIGVVVFPQANLAGEHSELDLMRYADIALYQAKNAGRDQSVIYSPEHQQEVNDRLEIERGLRVALESDQLKIFMQPQVNPQGETLSAEVLIRWMHPEEGMIPPFRFIPIAEETGLILRLGRWVMEKTLEQLSTWQAKGIPSPELVSVNVSAWQFTQTDFVDETRNLCSKWQIPPSRIVLEVTETALLRDIDETRLKLEALRNSGFRISLDDFGTGYSSLAYLRDLPLDELKIDKSFVDEVQPGNRQPLVESMIAIGQHMKMDVIAEGVETLEQAQELEKMGCVKYQGYYFARPMPAEDLPAWLEAHEKTEA